MEKLFISFLGLILFFSSLQLSAQSSKEKGDVLQFLINHSEITDQLKLNHCDDDSSLYIMQGKIVPQNTEMSFADYPVIIGNKNRLVYRCELPYFLKFNEFELKNDKADISFELRDSENLIQRFEVKMKKSGKDWEIKKLKTG